MCVLYVCLGLSCLAMFLIADYVRYLHQREKTDTCLPLPGTWGSSCLPCPALRNSAHLLQQSVKSLAWHDGTSVCPSDNSTKYLTCVLRRVLLTATYGTYIYPIPPFCPLPLSACALQSRIHQPNTPKPLLVLPLANRPARCPGHGTHRKCR
jgi:hypothetical protein